MALVVLAVIALVSAPLAGGRLSRLERLQVRWLWALPLAIGLQYLVFVPLADWHVAVLAAGHIASYCAAGAFVWANRRIPGLWLIALGGAANFAAIATNGGVMPASPAAMEAAGLVSDPTRFANSAAAEGAPLWFLGDVFAIPEAWPLSNVFSVGDVLLFAGVVWFVHRSSGSRLVPARWRGLPEDSSDAGLERAEAAG